MPKHKGKILVVDDNSGIRSALEILLPLHFSGVEIIPSPNELISRTASFQPDAVLLDMNFHRDINTGNEGLYWLSELKARFPDIEVVLFTAYADISLAVEGMKRGASDFIVKPWENDKLIKTLEDACIKAEKHRSGTGWKQKTETGAADDKMYWGNGTAMAEIRKTVEKIAPTDATVLITGENGTGKDVLAKEIHRLSLRSGKPLICVDAGSIPESLFESELFGHVKGAFTDARSDHKGKIEEADGGTLFLDEIGNIPLHLQAKLLRVLQNRTVTRLGDTGCTPIDIRLVCATNKDLPQMVIEGKFREDLFYRINTVHISLPPLRDRKDEILPLAEIFMKKFSEKYSRNVNFIGAMAAQSLESGHWRGNIRELQNCIEKAVIMSEGRELSVSGICPGTDMGSRVSPYPEWNFTQGSGQHGEETLEMIEEKAIRTAMSRYNGNLSMVAKSLDISRPTLYSKLRKYNI